MAKTKRIFTGKRKTAVAQAKITPGTGKVFINKVPLEILQPEVARNRIITALLVAEDVAKKFDIDVTVSGGGYMGQAEASSIAIARALVGASKSKKLPKSYSDYDRVFLAGDFRRTESKKFGGPGSRRRKQKSYR